MQQKESTACESTGRAQQQWAVQRCTGLAVDSTPAGITTWTSGQVKAESSINTFRATITLHVKILSDTHGLQMALHSAR